MDKLIGPQALLETIFEPDVRPSVYWLRDQRKHGRVPFYKIGGRIFFDADEVRAKLDSFKAKGPACR
jgi:hypothetical protein